MTFFCIPGPDNQNRWIRKNCPKFFHRVIFALWIQICNPNLCKSHTFWNTANIEYWEMIFFRIRGPDDENRWNWKNCTIFFHGVIFAFWIQICNLNLCKSHIFWITANIEKWSFFAYPDLMTKIGEIRKIARNSFIGQFLRSEFKSAFQIYVNPIYFEIQLLLGNDLFFIPGPDDQNRWNRKNCTKFFHGVIFAFWIQICNPNLCKSHIFWITANIEILSFFAYPDLMTKIDEIGKITRNSFTG